MSNLVINANSIYDRIIRIGRQTENLVSSITFNVQMWIDEYGLGECVLNVRRNGDGSAYPVPMTITGGMTTWTITDTDTSRKGRGEIQLFYTVGEKVKTSHIFTISCGESLVGGEVPEPYEDWLTELNRMTAEVEAAKTSASASAQAAASSAQTATDKATLASQKAVVASESATLATAKAQAAATSETIATTAAQTATTKASEAAESATSAQEYDESAQQSAVNAQTSATNAAASEAQAQHYAENASAYLMTDEEATNLLSIAKGEVNE